MPRFDEVRIGEQTAPTDFGYTGQRLDASTDGLMYYGARYYLPELRRFISADTVVPGAGNPQNLNRYSYGRNNPVKYTDPTGHVVCADDECGTYYNPRNPGGASPALGKDDRHQSITLPGAETSNAPLDNLDDVLIGAAFDELAAFNELLPTMISNTEMGFTIVTHPNQVLSLPDGARAYVLASAFLIGEGTASVALLYAGYTLASVGSIYALAQCVANPLCSAALLGSGGGATAATNAVCNDGNCINEAEALGQSIQIDGINYTQTAYQSMQSKGFPFPDDVKWILDELNPLGPDLGGAHGDAIPGALRYEVPVTTTSGADKVLEVIFQPELNTVFHASLRR